MKRAAELRGLAEQQHYGLVAARNLRLAAEGKRPLPEAVRAFLDAWRLEVQPHFRAEEELLLPELARALPPDDPLILRTLSEHVAIRRAVRDLEQGPPEQWEALAREIGQGLDDHIRFEERVLFPAVEQALAGASLERLGEELPRQAGCTLRRPDPGA